MFKLKGRFLGTVFENKKKTGFMRKFLVEQGNFAKDFLVFSRDPKRLSIDGPCEISVDVQDLVFISEDR